MALIDKLTAIADAIRGKTGGTDLLTLDDMAAAITGISAGGGGDVTVTEYIVTEDADRSLWLNEQGIKLVKGVNLLVSSKMFYNPKTETTIAGAVTLLLLLWDGMAYESTVGSNTANNKSHIRGFQVPQSLYALFASITSLNTGNTTKTTVAEDGLLTCTTSATGVTTGNYNNSFIESGYTYYLMQVPSEEVC
ncbi:hypothetical protein [Dysosmobacter sp.]|uniref:hypothetical protein n=1 Tax=Dysosmobacter sp. TaxID=2591382 RepID=UPI002A935518|nr:hypothetical protein [Dysosmobacter sp.]MDY5613656.1 hypothetical protein [Dysosmobacter sp.]